MQGHISRPPGRQPARGPRKPVVVTRAGAQPDGAVPKEVRSDELLGEARQLRIMHEGSVYTLRATSNNRLILTK